MDYEVPEEVTINSEILKKLAAIYLPVGSHTAGIILS